MSYNSFPSRIEVAGIRNRYPAGTRVELISLDDPYNRKLAPGDKGTVAFVDDIGTVHINWDSGSQLGIVLGVDCIKKL